MFLYFSWDIFTYTKYYSIDLCNNCLSWLHSLSSVATYWIHQDTTVTTHFRSFISINCARLVCRTVCDTSGCSRRGAARSVCDPLNSLVSLFRVLYSRINTIVAGAKQITAISHWLSSLCATIWCFPRLQFRLQWEVALARRCSCCGRKGLIQAVWSHKKKQQLKHHLGLFNILQESIRTVVLIWLLLEHVTVRFWKHLCDHECNYIPQHSGFALGSYQSS